MDGVSPKPLDKIIKNPEIQDNAIKYVLVFLSKAFFILSPQEIVK